MIKKNLYFILFFLSFSNSYAAYYDLSFSYAYESQIYGKDRNNSVISKTYSGSVTVYLFELLGIEINYSQGQEITSQPFNTSNLSSVGYTNKIQSHIFGLGLRQAFASRKSLVRPSLSIGYARQISESSSTFTYWNPYSASLESLLEELPKTDEHSVFATLSLQLKLQGSVKTIFEAFEFNKAKDNLKYLVGVSWFF